MIECIPEVSVLEIELLGELLQKFTARLLLISVFIHSNIDSLSNKEIIEYFPSLFLDFFRQKIGKFTEIKVSEILMNQSLSSQPVIFFFA
jgi:hypothetical protein